MTHPLLLLHTLRRRRRITTRRSGVGSSGAARFITGALSVCVPVRMPVLSATRREEGVWEAVQHIEGGCRGGSPNLVFAVNQIPPRHSRTSILTQYYLPSNLRLDRQHLYAPIRAKRLKEHDVVGVVVGVPLMSRP